MKNVVFWDVALCISCVNRGVKSLILQVLQQYVSESRDGETDASDSPLWPNIICHDNNEEFQHTDIKNLCSETMRLQIKNQRINETSSGNIVCYSSSFLFIVRRRKHQILETPCVNRLVT
jgi:hypothetical protein